MNACHGVPATLKNASAEEISVIDAAASSNCSPRVTGCLIVNADDWGRDAHTTGRILDCVLRRSISAVSAMVFMEDSERAAAIAWEHRIDTGLHLNLTTPFSVASCPPKLKEHQRKVAEYLRRCSFTRAVYHPWLGSSFEYVVKAQIEEYGRIYGIEPERFDGHHHMHLCVNILSHKLLPPRTIVRRHFSWETGEKPLRNYLFRKFTDSLLARTYRLADFFFSLAPIEPRERLEGIFSMAYQSVVELETHPVNQQEYEFLAGGRIFEWTRELPIASRFEVPSYLCPAAPISGRFEGIDTATERQK